jgi:hypothetical protein
VTVSFPGKVRRILYSSHPTGDDLRDAEAWVRDVRSRLSHIRGELEDIGRIESASRHDSLCNKVAGSLTLALIALHGLMDDGDRSFGERAKRLDALWEDVRANPDNYVIQDAEREERFRWKWRPLGIFERGGRA